MNRNYVNWLSIVLINTGNISIYRITQSYLIMKYAELKRTKTQNQKLLHKSKKKYLNKK